MGFENYVCDGQMSLFDNDENRPDEKIKLFPPPNIKVINSDCLEYMRKCRDSSYDITFTSPPYNDDGGANDGCKEKGFRHRKYNYVEKREDWLEWQLECIKEMQRITKKFVLYNVQPIQSNKENVYKLIGEMSNDLHMIIIWYKPNAQPQHYPHRISNSYEMLLAIKGNEFNKKKFWLNTDGQKNVIIQNINSNHKYSNEHRAIMSYEFADEIIKNYTEPNDTVFDPFCGLATTGIACMRNGRNFVGTELNERYYQLAVERIRNDV